MPCASRWKRAARPSWQAGCRGATWRCRPRPPRGCWIKEATSARRAALELLEAVRGGATFAAARDRHLAGPAQRDRRLAHELAAGGLRRRAARPSGQAGCRGATWRCRPRPPRGCWIKEATSARRAALELLEAVRGGATFAAARDRHLAGLAERDRRLAHELAAGVLRRRAQLDLRLPLATTDPRPHGILRLAAYQLRALDRVPAYAAVSTSVALAREIAGEAAAGFVNQALRKLPRRLPGFAEGAFIIQDPAHALVCRYAAVPPGALVYDACAAPGGKGVTLERLGARVVAGDARRDRLARLADTVRRAGVAGPGGGADLVAAPPAPAPVDAGLVDAPRPATRTLARPPP